MKKTNNTRHIPVLLHEAINSLKIIKTGTYIDCTFGNGGHSKAILRRINNNGQLFAIDKDPFAETEAKKISNPNFHFIRGSFSNILKYAHQQNIIGQVNGILLDLGISTSQLNIANRGFSFMLDGTLDMRINPNIGVSAKTWINTCSERNISNVLKKFGEEKFSKKIARAIVNYRLKNKLIVSTKQLVDIIKRVIPNKNRYKNPATRSFQAIRIYINEELKELQKLLNNVINILKPGGRLSIISFHSIEDRIIKQFIARYSKRTKVPKGIPVTENQINLLSDIKLKNIDRIFPTITEIINNIRSRSAVLRVVERT